jgi:hypothetical protein
MRNGPRTQYIPISGNHRLQQPEPDHSVISGNPCPETVQRHGEGPANEAMTIGPRIRRFRDKVSRNNGLYVLRRLGLAAIIGAVVFAGISAPVWGLYVSSFITSAIAGGIIGRVAGDMGESAYGRIEEMRRSGNVGCVTHARVGLNAAVLSLLIGGFIGYVSPCLTWPVVESLHPDASFPGDMVVFPLMFLGAILAFVLSLLYASGVIQSWQEARNRKLG